MNSKQHHCCAIDLRWQCHQQPLQSSLVKDDSQSIYRMHCRSNPQLLSLHDMLGVTTTIPQVSSLCYVQSLHRQECTLQHCEPYDTNRLSQAVAAGQTNHCWHATLAAATSCCCYCCCCSWIPCAAVGQQHAQQYPKHNCFVGWVVPLPVVGPDMTLQPHQVLCL